jgi:hypothetical protein
MPPVDTPTWEPLLKLAPDDIEDFMWMFDVELDDGTRPHAYKHRWTRRYVHLTDDGRAFAYVWREDKEMKRRRRLMRREGGYTWVYLMLWRR